MYKCSPIKSIYVKNFRNIGEVKLDFTESPIISLKGDNESGKTSIVKAFAVCALHAYTREQKSYIRDGTNGFGVAIELEDGSMVSRIKTNAINRYEVIDKDGNKWDTNKIDGAKLPIYVQEIMRLVEEPETREFLQVRTYENQLLFVTTSSSTNYKVMYDALKIEQLTKAIKLGSDESNKLKSDINKNDIKIEALMNNLKGIRIYDLEPLVNIRDRLKDQLESVGKLERAGDISNTIKDGRMRLGRIGMIDKYGLGELDLVQVNRYVNIYRLVYKQKELILRLKKFREINTLNNIDTTVENKIAYIMAKRDELEDKISSTVELRKLGELGELREYEAEKLNKSLELLYKNKASMELLEIIDRKDCELVRQEDFDKVYQIAKIIQLKNRNSLLKTEVIKCHSVIEQIEEYMKQCGARVITCTNCGEQLVISNDENEELVS